MPRLAKIMFITSLICLIGVATSWAGVSVVVGNGAGPSPSTGNEVLVSISTDAPVRGAQFDIRLVPAGIIHLTGIAPLGSLASLTNPYTGYNDDYETQGNNQIIRGLFFDYEGGSISPASSEAIIKLTFDVNSGYSPGTTVQMQIVQDSDRTIFADSDSAIPIDSYTDGVFTVTGGAEYPYEFAQGWNMFGLPINTEEEYTSYSFLNACSNCTQISRYVAPNFDGAVDLGGGFIVGTEFDLLPGEGYFVYLDQTETFPYTGQYFDAPVTVYFDVNWNMVSFPELAGVAYSAYDIISAIPECNQISRFNGDGFDGAVDLGGGFIVGVDFDIIRGEAYFISCTAAGSWTPPVNMTAAIQPIAPPQDLVKMETKARINTSKSTTLADLVKTRAIPAIDELYFSNPRANGVRVSWNTSGELSSTQVDYGPASGSLGMQAIGPDNVELHYVDIAGLGAFSEYYYTATSANADGSDTSAEDTFHTANDIGTATPYFAAGAVQNQAGSPVLGAFVYLRVHKANDGPVSWVEMNFTGGSNGGFTIDMNAARNPASGLGIAPAVGDQAEIWIDGGSQGTYSNTFTITPSFLNVGTLQLVQQVDPVPVIQVSPSLLTFADTDVGQSATAEFYVSNAGTADLVLNAPTVTGDVFSLNSPTTFPITIAPGARTAVTFEMGFAPTVVDEFTGTIAIPHNDAAAGNESVVSLMGNGTGAPEFSVNPSGTYDFGSVTIGQDDSAPFTVTNIGNIPGLVSSVLIDNALFTSDFAGPVNVAADGSTVFNVTYTPDDETPDTAQMTIFTDANTLTVNLSGTGTTAPEAHFVVDPSSLDFGNVVDGSQATDTFSITNDGNASGTISAINSDNDAFTTDFTGFSGPVTLNPGDSPLVITVTYTASLTRVITGELTVVTDANSPTVAVSGTPVALPELSLGTNDGQPGTTVVIPVDLTTTVDIAGVEFGIENTPDDLTLVGVTGMTVLDGWSINGNEMNFVFVQLGGNPIPAGFDGTIAELELMIGESACSGTVDMALTGTDLAPNSIPHTLVGGTVTVLPFGAEVACEPAAPEFYSDNAQDPHTQSIQIQNTAPACQGESLEVTDITITGLPNDVYFFTINDALEFPYTIEANGYLEFSLTYDATISGTHEATLNVFSSAGDLAVPLLGETGSVAIEMASFDAAIGYDEVILNWQVVDQTNLIGFNVYRAVSGYDREQVNDQMVSSFSDMFTYTDEVLGDITYEYWVESVEADGRRTEFGPVLATPKLRPTNFNLSQNYPNPFNPSTTIAFDVPNGAHVGIKVYNVNGQLVKTLVDEYVEVGNHFVTWDGTDNNGNEITSGVYFYRLEAGSNLISTKRMMLMK